MEITQTVDGTDFIFTISYRFGMVDNLRDGMDWNVTDWTVTHVDDHELDQSTRSIWANKLNAEDICYAIMAAEAE